MILYNNPQKKSISQSDLVSPSSPAAPATSVTSSSAQFFSLGEDDEPISLSNSNSPLKTPTPATQGDTNNNLMYAMRLICNKWKLAPQNWDLHYLQVSFSFSNIQKSLFLSPSLLVHLHLNSIRDASVIAHMCLVSANCTVGA